jgi:hypothetical protein
VRNAPAFQGNNWHTSFFRKPELVKLSKKATPSTSLLCGGEEGASSRTMKRNEAPETANQAEFRVIPALAEKYISEGGKATAEPVRCSAFE